MKRLLFFAVGLLLATAAAAQHYRPFRPGLLYQLSTAAGDSTFGIQLGRTPYAQGTGDSLYYFKTHLGAAPAGLPNPCSYRLYNGYATPLGMALLVRNMRGAAPEYQLWLSAAAGSAITLKPSAPLNQPWTASAGLTAQVTARGVASVLGQPDSVVTISFPNGRALRLSKEWGFVDGSVLLDFPTRRAARQLTLTGLPTKRLGQSRLGARAMYDFQPGDVFWYSFSQNTGTAPMPFPYPPPTYYGDSVLTRTPSRSGDTITYRIARGYNSQQAWSVYTLVVHDKMAPRLLEASNRYEPTPPNGNAGAWLTDMAPVTGRFNNRPVQRLYERYRHCTASGADTAWVAAAMPDLEQYEYYSPGLGRVNYSQMNTTCCYTFINLVGYRKRGISTPTNPVPAPEQWGTLPRFSSPLLGAAGHKPAASTAVFPNPFARTLTVRFETQRPQEARVRLFNGLGQLVYEQRQRVPGSTAQLELALPTLPAGLYTLHLQHDGRTEVLKVTAAP